MSTNNLYNNTCKLLAAILDQSLRKMTNGEREMKLSAFTIINLRK